MIEILKKISLDEIILWSISVFIPFSVISVTLFYTLITNKFHKKSLMFKIIYISISLLVLIPAIYMTIKSSLWYYILFFPLSPIAMVLFAKYGLLFSAILPVPVLIASKCENYNISNKWFILYFEIFIFSTILMILYWKFILLQI